MAFSVHPFVVRGHKEECGILRGPINFVVRGHKEECDILYLYMITKTSGVFSSSLTISGPLFEN